jgi:hypothetical protein
MDFTSHSLLQTLNLKNLKNLNNEDDIDQTGIYKPKVFKSPGVPLIEGFERYNPPKPKPTSNMLCELHVLVKEGFLNDTQVPLDFSWNPIVQANKLTGDLYDGDFSYLKENDLIWFKVLKVFQGQTLQIDYSKIDNLSIPKYIANTLNYHIKSKNIIKFVLHVNVNEDSIYWDKVTGHVNIRYIDITR